MPSIPFVFSSVSWVPPRFVCICAGASCKNRCSNLMSGCFPGISQSRISHWLLQHGSDLSEQKKRAFYRWYTLEKTTPGTSGLINWHTLFWHVALIWQLAAERKWWGGGGDGDPTDYLYCSVEVNEECSLVCAASVKFGHMNEILRMAWMSESSIIYRAEDWVVCNVCSHNCFNHELCSLASSYIHTH